MSKKLVSAICASMLVVAAGVCVFGYTLGHNGPWWLVILGAGILSAIFSMIGKYTREEDAIKKHKDLISCICSSVSMVSVFVFLVLLLRGLNNSWLIVVAGGVISYVIYMIDKAVVSDKKDKK